MDQNRSAPYRLICGEYKGHKTLKGDAIPPGQPDSLEKAHALAARFIEHYDTARLHSALGYLTPADRGK